MSGAWLWARREIRRRWVTLVVLALLISIAGGAAMTAAIGARRSAVVVEETMREHRQPDVMSLPDKPGFDWEPIVTLPYVESSGLFAATALCLSETGGLENRAGALCTQPPLAGGWYDSIWGVDVLEGRMATAPGEIAINRLAQRERGLNVGDRLHLEGVRPGRLEDYWAERPRGSRPWGPTFPVTVSGVFAGEDAWRVISGGRGQPGFIASESFMPANKDDLEYRVQAFLRLRGGEDDIRRLRDDIAAITGEAAFPIRNVHEARRRVERSAGVEAAALWMFALAVLATASVLLGQAVARLVSGGGGDDPTLRSLGMAPSRRIATLAAPGAVAGILGALGSVLVALAASPQVPVELARGFDLHRGVKFDLSVLVPGALGIAALFVVVSVGAAAARVRGSERAAASSSRPSGRSIARLALPAPVALGVRLALERRRGADSIAVRPALIGAVVGVAAVVAAFTVRGGVADTLAHPERAGQAWDLAYLPELPEGAITAEPDVAGAAKVTRAIADIDGVGVPTYAIRPVGEPLDQTLIAGRAPERPDEVALGPSTATALGAEVGDRLPAGPGGGRPVRIVGEALLWEEGGHAAYDEGAWTTGAGLKRLRPPQIDWSSYFLDLRAGADDAGVRERLAAAGGVVDELWLTGTPAALDNLSTTRSIPALLGGLLALLGIGAVANVLLGAVRRRRRDLAVLRALGMSGRQARAVLGSQATTVAAVGLALGLPLGIVAGHLIWRLIATAMPIEYVGPGIVLGALTVIPAALLVANAVALWPARVASRTSPAAVLRTE